MAYQSVDYAKARVTLDASCVASCERCSAVGQPIIEVDGLRLDCHDNLFVFSRRGVLICG